MRIPKGLVDHLLLLLTPPEGFGGHPLYFPDVHQVEWSQITTNSLSGLVICGTPNEQETLEIDRVLLPGGHLLLIAPEESPIGWEGAIVLEDNGLEIRDSFLIIEDASEPFYYIPKVSRREREAGCVHLPGMTGAKAVNRKKGSKGLSNPRAGASRTAKQVKNFHETVKPKKLMEKVLADVPPGQVVDPFMGSGSTALACLKTGHDFVGIEQEPDYLQIAEARVRYWARETPGWRATEIRSDQEPPKKKPSEKPSSFFDWIES